MSKRFFIITGVSGSGKSFYAKNHFKKEEIIQYTTTRNKRKNEDCICVSKSYFIKHFYKYLFIIYKNVFYGICIPKTIKQIFKNDNIVFILSPKIAQLLINFKCIYFIILDKEKSVVKKQLKERDGHLNRLNRFDDENKYVKKIIDKISKNHKIHYKIVK